MKQSQFVISHVKIYKQLLAGAQIREISEFKKSIWQILLIKGF